MLRIVKEKELKDLEQFGFHSFKANRNQTNYYRCFAHGCKVIIINNVLREVVISEWYDDDTRIHKIPKCNRKDTTPIEDVLFDLTQAGFIEKISKQESDKTFMAFAKGVANETI